MIMDALLNLLTSLVNGLYGALPPFDMTSILAGRVTDDPNSYGGLGAVTSGSMTALQAVFVLLWQLNKFVPVDHFVAICGISVTIWLAVLGYKALRYIIGLVRGGPK